MEILLNLVKSSCNESYVGEIVQRDTTSQKLLAHDDNVRLQGGNRRSRLASSVDGIHWR